MKKREFQQQGLLLQTWFNFNYLNMLRLKLNHVSERGSSGPFY